MTMRTEAVFASALAIACARPAAADPDEPMWGEKIAEVSLSGIERGRRAALLRSLSCRRGRRLTRAAVAADIRRLWRRAGASDVDVSVSREGAGPAVEFRVTPLPRVAAVEVRGNRAIEDREALELIALRPGAPASPAAIHRGAAALEARYRKKGYDLAEVKVEKERRRGEGGVALAFAVTEGRSITLRRVVLAGNRRLGDRALRRAMASRRGRPLDRAELERDRERLRGRYLEAGYVTATVAAPRVALSRDRRSAYARFAITEGPRYRVGAVSGGLDVATGPASGQVYRHSDVGDAARAMVLRLRQRGHPFARVEPELELDRERHTVDIRFAVDPGPRAVIEEIAIRGNDRTRASVIRRELVFARGERFTQGALEVSRRHLLALGFFDAVDIDAAPGSRPDLAVVTVTVKERDTGTFSVGAGLASSQGFIGTAQVSQRNLFGTGHSLALQAAISERQRDFALRYRDPRVFDSRWSASAEIYNRREQWQGFARRATGGAVSVGRPLGRHLYGSLTYRAEKVGAETSGDLATLARLAGPANSADLLRGGLVSSLRATLTYDTRDNPLFPRRGSDAGGYLEVASPLIGSEVDSERAGAWLRTHYPIGPLTLHAGAEVGVVTTRDPRGVPLAQRFQAGGIGSVRGYAPGELGPRLLLGTDPGGALDEVSLGGNLMARASVELTAPLIESLGIDALVFFDAGNVYNLDSRYCEAAGCPGSAGDVLGGLRTSVGFGLRWRSPIGPLRFEWGIPLRRAPGDPPIRFHFGVGFSF